jgi:hypothetical protein
MIEFIQSITDKEIRYIANSDYGDSADIYYDLVKKVIFNQSCIMTLDQHYSPGEVIALCSYYPEKGHEREFCICRLLYIINRGVFGANDLAAQLAENECLYRSMSEYYSELIFSAYRWAGF